MQLSPDNRIRDIPGLTEGLAALSEQADDDTLKTAAVWLVTNLLNNSENVIGGRIFALGLINLGKHLDEQSATQLALKLLNAMENKTHCTGNANLAMGMMGLQEKLDDSLLRRAAKLLSDRINHSIELNDTALIGCLASASEFLAQLGNHVDAQSAQHLVIGALDAIKKNRSGFFRYMIPIVLVGLDGMNEKLNSTIQLHATAQLLEITASDYPYPLEEITPDLLVRIDKLIAQQLAIKFLAVINEQTNWLDLIERTARLRIVTNGLSETTLIQLLKWPVSEGEIQKNLLSALEIKTGERFDGNLWKMVDWAKAKGYSEVLMAPVKSHISQ